MVRLWIRSEVVTGWVDAIHLDHLFVVELQACFASFTDYPCEWAKTERDFLAARKFPAAADVLKTILESSPSLPLQRRDYIKQSKRDTGIITGIDIETSTRLFCNL